jgi:dTDP-4-dehydrorhamnose reductase
MRWLVTGAGGMLGSDLRSVLADREVTAYTRADLDITHPVAVEDAVAGHDVVINAAAWTAVDDAEAKEADAFEVNAVGAANVAQACARTGALLLHMSTDYVFDGRASQPYPEDAPLAPASAYGRTKAAGEWAVRAAHPLSSIVIRTAWLYGEGGPNFVATMLRLMRERDTLDVVDDQTGQPTWSLDLARRMVMLVDAGVRDGTYHATNGGHTTWYGLAQRIAELSGHDPQRIRPTTTSRFPRPAPRPRWSVLGHDGWARAGLEPMRSWQAALGEAMPRLLSNQESGSVSRA